MPISKTAFDGPIARSSPNSKRCATPGCQKRRGHGDTKCFCKRHANELAVIREELEYEMFTRGRFAQRRDQKRREQLLGSTCCEPGCYEPRIAPVAYCASHAEQYAQEAA